MFRHRRSKADDHRMQLGLGEPAWHVAPQDAAWRQAHHVTERKAGIVGLASFAGNNEHEFQSAPVTVAHEISEPHMGFVLAQAVQVQSRFDAETALGNFLDLTRFEFGPGWGVAVSWVRLRGYCYS